MASDNSAHVDDFAAAHLPPRQAWPRMRYDTLPELAAIPDRVNCAVLLDKPAREQGERPALHYNDQTWSYAELREKADRIAHVLVDDLGIKPGNRVLLRGPNNPMMVAAWFAVMKVGAVAVATMPLLRARELVFICDKARIDVALCDERLREELEKTIAGSQLARALYFHGGNAADSLEARMADKPAHFETVDTAATDTCLIAFTSGTTGQPKGCMHFHRDVLAIAETFGRHVLKPGPDDVFAGSPPLAFTFGLGALVIFPFRVGASTVLVERYTPDVTLQTISRYRVTTLFTAPTAYRGMLGRVGGHDLSSLHTCVSAGEALPKPTWQDWVEATGIRIIDGIGSTELLHIFIGCAGDDIRPGSTGRPVPGYEARVVDDNGLEVPPDTIGNLIVRGPTGCRYLDNPERQAKYVRDGWNWTGDAYSRDADGYFWYQSRTDDLIISSGYNIAGLEVEEAMLEHDAVQECAVVGVADAQRGQIVKAYVVLRDGAKPDQDTARELQEYVKQALAPYKYPRAIEFLEALPRTPTGKVQRFVLRERG
ncbi:MAG: benzoate-CoA ligase family protein [Aquisalimonadaceae bacterium]